MTRLWHLCSNSSVPCEAKTGHIVWGPLLRTSGLFCHRPCHADPLESWACGVGGLVETDCGNHRQATCSKMIERLLAVCPRKLPPSNPASCEVAQQLPNCCSGSRGSPPVPTHTCWGELSLWLATFGERLTKFDHQSLDAAQLLADLRQIRPTLAQTPPKFGHHRSNIGQHRSMCLFVSAEIGHTLTRLGQTMARIGQTSAARRIPHG